MNNRLSILLSKFARYGVLHREAVKNEMAVLKRLLRGGFAAKAYKQGRVFYELTEKALPLLEYHRKKLLAEAGIRACLPKAPAFYSAFLEDVRFVDEKSAEARDFLFLGDWQLVRPLVPAQLELAKHRFYREKVPERRRRAT